MFSIKRGFHHLLHNKSQFVDSCIKHLWFLFPDKLYLSLRYRFQMGKWINWNNPKTFTEKMQWLKLYNRKPEYTIMVDKYAVKRFVSDLIGEQFVIPTIDVFGSPENIDWQSLPQKYVVKTTHSGGGNGVVICHDNNSFDFLQAKCKITKSYKSRNYHVFREWPYKNVKPQIIVEKYMSNGNDVELTDYKFYCFDGIPRYCQVIRDRHTGETIDFYDMEWNLMPFVGLNPNCDNGKTLVAKPESLNKMIEICQKLSANIPFVRIDLYEINRNPYFGEITFFPASGFGRFKPYEWDEILGQFINLGS